MVDNAPSVGIVRCSKNLVDAREKNIQQRAKSLSLAGAAASTEGVNKNKHRVGSARFAKNASQDKSLIWSLAKQIVMKTHVKLRVGHRNLRGIYIIIQYNLE